jgi:carboxypeptidase C (cathepsin A)
MRLAAVTCILALAIAIPARAAEPGEGRKVPHAAAEAPAAPAVEVPKPSVTRHQIRAAGRIIKYTATAGWLPLQSEAGKPQATIFFIAYTADGERDPSRRPIAFAFNGGPGASSIWLHVGGIGPKRVLLAADGTQLPESDRLVDNDYTWLDFTDLVFVDPIGTGYSRAAPGVEAKQFYEARKDVAVAGDFIRLYVTRYERWLSPKFVVGESYGTTRAAALCRYLQRETGTDLAGLILLSSVLNFQVFLPDRGNDTPYPLAVPSLTAAALYHHRLAAAPPDLTRALTEAEHWALNQYVAALAQGDALADSERDRIAEQMAQLTGLTTEYVESSRLRVSAPAFAKELLRAEGRTLGLLDSRVKGTDLSRRGEYPSYDPAMFLVTGPYEATLNDYLRRELKCDTTLPYVFLSRQVNGAWQYGSAGQGYLYVGDELAEAICRDSRLQVLAAAGYYDLTAPYLSQKYTFDHLGLDAASRQRIDFRLYASGHQIYTDTPSLRQLKGDAAAFVRNVRATPPAAARRTP